MGIFGRLGTVLRSNINDLISKAEDPEKMLNQIIADMQESLIESKKQVAVAIADEKRLKKQWDSELAQAQEWERKAMMAVRAGNDELAREALSRKAEHDKLGGEYQKNWERQKASCDALRDTLRLLTNKIEEAARKKNLLIARKKRAEAQKTIHATMQGLQDNSAFAAFDRMEAKIDQSEAEADAMGELSSDAAEVGLEDKFKSLETTASADDALASLKAKMGVGPGVGVSAQNRVKIEVPVEVPSNVKK
ncbi:MAG: PspA/IM30 family protein [Deltaproteobacteria bacterium]|nr:PspA/IM30 family protein [Deltaproteobacteria bacterium]